MYGLSFIIPKLINNSKKMFACGNSAISIMTFAKDCMLGNDIRVPMLCYQLVVQCIE